MGPEIVLAGAALLAAIAYAVLGGADFGGGVWDLLAFGPRASQQRGAIAHAMGPVWEANHIWLVFVMIILFSAFPAAYAALSIALYLPFHLVLLGIILRGASFVFRAYSPQSLRGLVPEARRWSTIFGIASLLTPFLLGMVLSAISAGQLRVVDGVVQTSSAPWLTPLAWAMGAQALALCAYLAAVYLTLETADALRDDFRRRALLAGTAVVALAALTLPLLYFNAPHLWVGLISWRAAPVLVVGGLAALLSGLALLRRWYRTARAASIVQVACLLAGWGVAQYPYVIYPDVTVQSAAATRGVLIFLAWAIPAGLALVLPALWLLFRVFKSESAISEY